MARLVILNIKMIIEKKILKNKIISKMEKILNIVKKKKKKKKQPLLSFSKRILRRGE